MEYMIDEIRDKTGSKVFIINIADTNEKTR